MSEEVELRISHDHSHLAALIRDFRDLVKNMSGGGSAQDPEASLVDEAREILALIKEDTYEHFEREEHGLFPNLVNKYPDLRSDIHALQVAHDVICQQIELVSRLLSRTRPTSAGLTSLSELGDAAAQLAELNDQHTAEEWKVIRDLLVRLDESSRAVILEQLQEI